MTYPKAAVTAEIVDLRTGDTVAGFGNPALAEDALAAMADRDPDEVRFLVLVFFDEDGRAIDSHAVSELLPA